MLIRHLLISNFKSFAKIDIPLKDLNIIIGANSSGKSNFVEIFKFINNIERFGLKDAISMEGGSKYLLNSDMGISQPLTLKITSTSKEVKNIKKTVKGKRRNLIVRTNELIYSLKFNIKNDKDDYTIIQDEVSLDCTIYEIGKDKSEKEVGKCDIRVLNEKGYYKREVKYNLNEELNIKDSDLFWFTFPEKVKLDVPLLGTPFFYALAPLSRSFSDISTYNIDPNSCKTAIAFTGRSRLEESGKNLVLVLKEILNDKKQKERFLNLIKDLLPAIHDVEVKTLADKMFNLELKEKYNKEFILPASLLSDGTVSIIAIIVALYFQHASLKIIEEPERNIHPSLIMKLMEMIKELSKHTQIIVTTHSPEILRVLDDLEGVYLLSKKKEGKSIISKPIDSKEVKIFLKNEINIEELYKSNLL